MQTCKQLSETTRSSEAKPVNAMANNATADYLLDRVDIEDVIRKMYLSVDQRQYATLHTEIFADQVEMDYTDLLGGTPYITTAQKQAEAWEAQTSEYSATQHIPNILVDLPRPDSGPLPDTASAIANITATLVSPKGAIARNGGRLHLGLQRTSVAAGKNPWRITSMKVYKSWMEGDFETSSLKQANDNN